MFAFFSKTVYMLSLKVWLYIWKNVYFHGQLHKIKQKRKFGQIISFIRQ